MASAGVPQLSVTDPGAAHGGSAAGTRPHRLTVCTVAEARERNSGEGERKRQEPLQGAVAAIWFEPGEFFDPLGHQGRQSGQAHAGCGQDQVNAGSGPEWPAKTGVDISTPCFSVTQIRTRTGSGAPLTPAAGDDRLR